MTEFPLYPILQGEKMDDVLESMQISDYCRASYMNSVHDMQFERDVSRDFTTDASLVTLASRYDPYENEPKLGTSDTVLAYPSRIAEDAGSNDYSIITQSIGNTANFGYEGVNIDLSTRWDFNKIVSPLVEHSIVDQSFSRISNCSLNNRHQIHEQSPYNPEDASSCLTSNKPAQLSQLYSASRYLNVMQEILADFAHFSLNDLNKIRFPATGSVTETNEHVHPSNTDPRGFSSMKPSTRNFDFENKRKQLLVLLQVVDDQYNRLVDDIHKVISAYHAVADLHPRIHASFALQAVSSLYKNLRERISNLILAMGATCDSRIGSPGEDKSFEVSFIQKQWALEQLKRKDQHLWRPQRGLPERSVSVLRAWMFQNFLHPYPKDAEKDLLAVKSGLTRGQVSNWFINARVRLWKPLIEEMYSEMSRRNEGSSRNLGTINHGRYSIN